MHQVKSSQLTREAGGRSTRASPMASPEPTIRTGALRFVITSTVEANRELQLQELQLFATTAPDAEPVRIRHVHNPGGKSPLRQLPSMLTDGNTKASWSKFVNTNHAADHQTTLEVGLEAPSTPVAAYQFITANDNPGRDPTAWHVSRLVDGQWEVVHVCTGVVPPAERHAPYARQPLLRPSADTLAALGLPRYTPAEKHWLHYLSPAAPPPPRLDTPPKDTQSPPALPSAERPLPPMTQHHHKPQWPTVRILRSPPPPPSDGNSAADGASATLDEEPATATHAHAADAGARQHIRPPPSPPPPSPSPPPPPMSSIRTQLASGPPPPAEDWVAGTWQKQGAPPLDELSAASINEMRAAPHAASTARASVATGSRGGAAHAASVHVLPGHAAAARAAPNAAALALTLSSIGLPIFVCLILVLAICRKLRALCLRVSLRACWRTCGWACSAICCVGGAVRSAVRWVCSCFGLYRSSSDEEEIAPGLKGMADDEAVGLGLHRSNLWRRSRSEVVSLLHVASNDAARRTDSREAPGTPAVTLGTARSSRGAAETVPPRRGAAAGSKLYDKQRRRFEQAWSLNEEEEGEEEDEDEEEGAWDSSGAAGPAAASTPAAAAAAAVAAGMLSAGTCSGSNEPIGNDLLLSESQIFGPGGTAHAYNSQEQAAQRAEERAAIDAQRELDERIIAQSW